MVMSSFSASGKLMLFGEYLVLRGSKCFAIPLNVGQQLTVKKKKEAGVSWKSFEGEECWLAFELSSKLELISSSDQKKASLVVKLLKIIQNENPELTIDNLCFTVNLDFNREFGFGTSSTFISLLSQWSGVNPYLLLENSFGGSGYDIAAATATKPFVYTLKERKIKELDLPKRITNHLLFVYLGKKQVSSKEILAFKDKEVSSSQIDEMNTIIEQATQSTHIEEWENAMVESKNLLSSILHIPAVKDHTFSDYPFAIKSLGAWGGDFVMATFRELSAAKSYFLEKGFDVFYTYDEIVKPKCHSFKKGIEK